MAAVPVPIPPADDAPHLLVVDDDRRIRDLLSRFLCDRGLPHHHRRQRRDGARQADEPELRSADPRRDDAGRDRLRVRPQDIRKTSAVPILMLTARDAAESRITGLEIGADDYVAKPFEPRELSLRIANILKRAKPAAAPPVENRSASANSCSISAAPSCARATRSSA